MNEKTDAPGIDVFTKYRARWQLEIGGPNCLVIQITGDPPCWFFRTMQQAILGFKWTRLP
jgi:hypothetical protein